MPSPEDNAPETLVEGRVPEERIAEGRIVVNLDELLYQRRMTLTELAAKVDITLANLSILKTGKAKAIRFSTLEAICRALECQPGDLLAYRGE
jgi:putative transcriptional regulator